MFHHFHDDKLHSKSQGSISRDDFYKLIKFIGRKNIINADEFFEKFKKKKLKKTEICFTFDDALKCQIDIALPVLEDEKIKSFFFIYSSLFEGKPDNLEIFRYFRTNYFKSINSFYKDFYGTLKEDLTEFLKKNLKEIESWKKKFPVYSIEDIKFRLVRDIYLGKNKYEKIMFEMLNQKKIEIEGLYTKLLINKNDLKKLDQLGHLIGLHSHSHPTRMEDLSTQDQKKEYEKCIEVLAKILNKPKAEIKYMSHPNGSYNKNTLKVLKEIGIEIGFKQIMGIEPERGMRKINNSFLEIAREDHSDIFQRMLG